VGTLPTLFGFLEYEANAAGPQKLSKISFIPKFADL